MKFYAIRKTLPDGNCMWASRSYARRTNWRNQLDKYVRLYTNLNGATRSLDFAIKHESNEPHSIISLGYNYIDVIQLIELELVIGQVVSNKPSAPQVVTFSTNPNFIP